MSRKPSVAKAQKKSPKSRAVATKKTAAPVEKKRTRAKTAIAKAQPAQATAKGGFMWRLLERKREELKQNQDRSRNSHVDPFARENLQPSNGFGRFNGPRRRVG